MPIKMVTDGELPYLLAGNLESPLLLYLHGLGEAHENAKGVKSYAHLKNQGPPKHFEELESSQPTHPLVAKMKLLAPQLPTRDKQWMDEIEEIKALVAQHRVEGKPVYVMGFSKGGRAALDVAEAIGADAVVTIDAAPMQPDANASAKAVMAHKQKRAVWAIHTTYPAGARHAPIEKFNQALGLPKHDSLESEPEKDARCRTPVPVDNTPVEHRHVKLCDTVSKSQGPYRWLLKHSKADQKDRTGGSSPIQGT